MKAKDLMINDWVQQQNCTTPSQVAGVTSNKIHTVWADGSKHSKDEYYFDPIKLNWPILKLNGWYAEGLDVGLETVSTMKHLTAPDVEYIEGYDRYFFMDFEVQYVHELQQLLRLLGKRGMADNFKV